MNADDSADVRPWSARRPQSLVISTIVVVLGVALVLQGLSSIRDGRGGLVPYFIILGGPALACYYVWYFVFRRFEADGD